MSYRIAQFGRLITTYSKTTILVVLLVTALMAVGIPMVEQESDTEQFEVDSEAAEAAEFIQARFGVVDDEPDNRTTLQVIQRPADGNALSRASLIESLAFQQALRENEKIAPTLVRDSPSNSVANVLALTYLGQLLEPQQDVDAETLAALEADEITVVATLLGFEEEREQETIVEVFDALSALESGENGENGENGDDEFDIEELTEEEIEALAAQFGFDETEQETVVALFETVTADEPPVSSSGFAQLDENEQQMAADILAIETMPPEECLAAFGAGGEPPLSCYIWALETMSDEELDGLIQSVLGEDGSDGVLSLLPTDYERGSTSASSSAIFVTQRDDVVLDSGRMGMDAVTDAQLETRAVAATFDSDYAVLGGGIIFYEIDQSLGDSFAIVGPLALLFVVIALSVAYRDPLDIILGVFGILAVLIWTFGFMGWTDTAFNQLLISVPVLLIGLSIDYAIHVFMRHREQRSDETEDIKLAMALALGGVGVALIWVTATAAIGFLANLVSPIGPLQDFAIVSAFGVFSALLIFGALIPAMKVELDSRLEARGWNRKKRAFGTGGSRFSKLLSTGAVAARRVPVVVVVLALLLTLGGAYGATQVDTSFNQEDFIADSPPGWTQYLPGGLAPGEYQAKNDLEFVQGSYQPEDSNADLLIQGDVTNSEVLRWMAEAERDIGERDTTFEIAGQPDVRTPLSVMEALAAQNESSAFAQQFNEMAGDDGVPEGDMEALFELFIQESFEQEFAPAVNFFALDEGGNVEALRIIVGVRGDASINAIAADMRTSATNLEETSGTQLQVTATGDAVIFDDVETGLFETVIQGLIITFITVFVFLSVAYRATGNPASLGIVTLIPVLLAVAWILGSMWMLDIPFNALTGTITSLTIGLGIAYSIHISSRYELELRRQGDVWKAMETTVTGTGGALLGSAATTVGGFGTLALAILPVLQQFGIITGLTIIYAFLASVLVLPALLILWTRYLGPSEYFPANDEEAKTDAVTAADIAGEDD